MLFNSHEFLFVFLPLVVAVFFFIGKYNHQAAAGWLAASSLFFYGWWIPVYVVLLLASIAFNYVMGFRIARASPPKKKPLLFFALTVNLALLFYYKYALFITGNVPPPFYAEWNIDSSILPLGISFFTFTQIAFLVDVYRSEAKEYNPVHYVLFVSYFPHLIAGPVLHHKEMMPQFSRQQTYHLNSENIAVGLTIFSIGLFKKVVLADPLSPAIAAVFTSGVQPTAFEAWGAALSYTLQIYFDFSGYSDMAIGLSRLFGIVLPLNFNSPYKATNIVEFWRRWHMTLSRFLRDYLYYPLGGNRRGEFRRHINLMITMLLGGLWHGAGWQFLIWGGIHGLYLVVNHSWQSIRQRAWWAALPTGRLEKALARLLTFLSVVIAWVFFRAQNTDDAIEILKGMAGMNGMALPENWFASLGVVGQALADIGLKSGGKLSDQFDVMQWLWIASGLAIAWLFPNTQEIMNRYKPALDVTFERRIPRKLEWTPSASCMLVSSILLGISLARIGTHSEFLYFQF